MALLIEEVRQAFGYQHIVFPRRIKKIQEPEKCHALKLA